MLRVMVTEKPWLLPTCWDWAMSGRDTTFAEVTGRGCRRGRPRSSAAGHRLSGSAAQPVSVTVLPLAVAFSSAPNGLCAAISGCVPIGAGTTTVRQPSAVLPPAAMLTAVTQTVWLPGAAATVMAKPGVGPVPTGGHHVRTRRPR